MIRAALQGPPIPADGLGQRVAIRLPGRALRGVRPRSDGLPAVVFPQEEMVQGGRQRTRIIGPPLLLNGLRAVPQETVT